MKSILDRIKRSRYSLRNQVAAIFIFLIILSMAAIVLINHFFLEDYYVEKKTAVLQLVFEQLQDFSVETAEEETEENSQNSSEEQSSDETQDSNISDDLIKVSTENNLTWVILNPYTEYVAGWGQSVQVMSSRLFGYIYGIEKTDSHVLEQNDRYVIQKTKDRFVGMDYVEMWGSLDNGNICLIRSPLESIRESASISNGFVLYVGIGILVVSGLIIWLVTNRITRPISELTNLSRRMTELDFDARYGSVAHNEID
ncbi:MAG TPA: two-component sensor histidine kinase, partial [Candidatus Blautia gallistercoris]|nr:two-component sensor histidine kinase [Candidatus Blautia gallistercoris]